MSRIGVLSERCKRTIDFNVAVRSLNGPIRRGVQGFIFLLTVLFVTSMHGQAVAPDAQRQSLGSLNTVGEVYVNESRAPSELTIFSGDVVRTADSGTAIVTTADKGTFQISRQSQVVFTGDSKYFAELKLGTIFLKSPGGAVVVAPVRAGNFVIVQTNRNETTSATVASIADGSFFITCSAGNVGVVPVQETSAGLFLQAGQSARITPQNELVAAQTATPSTVQPAGTRHRLWIYLGLAGGGAAAAGVAAVLIHDENHPSMSPSSP